MIPMEPGPEDYARMLSERRGEMERSRAIARFAHSRTGLFTSFLRALADRIDPTGRQRRERR
ncbi:MAG TPA: hypothetical protein VJR46_14115 [Candidatus Dormibacteraeota bacterium]|nr:hypothetical protein [Candidatus Dormibacteraeota bacterium]